MKGDQSRLQALFSKQSRDCYLGSAVIFASYLLSMDAALLWRRALWTRVVCSSMMEESVMQQKPDNVTATTGVRMLRVVVYYP